MLIDLDYLKNANMIAVDCEVDIDSSTVFSEILLLSKNYEGQTVSLSNKDGSVIIEVTISETLIAEVPKVITEIKFPVKIVKAPKSKKS